MKTSLFVKRKRSLSGLTQPELAEKAGVGLRFIRELEQGKETLRLDKVNQVLNLFGYEMGPVKTEQPLTNDWNNNEKGRNNNAQRSGRLAE
jgi:y4mF family transcriptional regulator